MVVLIYVPIWSLIADLGIVDAEKQRRLFDLLYLGVAFSNIYLLSYVFYFTRLKLIPATIALTVVYYGLVLRYVLGMVEQPPGAATYLATHVLWPLVWFSVGTNYKGRSRLLMSSAVCLVIGFVCHAFGAKLIPGPDYSESVTVAAKLGFFFFFNTALVLRCLALFPAAGLELYARRPRLMT